MQKRKETIQGEMADEARVWPQRSGILQVKNLSIAGIFKLKGDMSLCQEPMMTGKESA